MDKYKIIRIKIFGILWIVSMIMCGKEVVSSSVCLIIGIPAGIMFMRETRL